MSALASFNKLLLIIAMGCLLISTPTKANSVNATAAATGVTIYYSFGFFLSTVGAECTTSQLDAGECDAVGPIQASLQMYPTGGTTSALIPAGKYNLYVNFNTMLLQKIIPNYNPYQSALNWSNFIVQVGSATWSTPSGANVGEGSNDMLNNGTYSYQGTITVAQAAAPVAIWNITLMTWGWFGLVGNALFIPTF